MEGVVVRFNSPLSKGFTLIELMLVVGIMSILVMLAVPAYQEYSIRAKVTECINQASVTKLHISEYRETVSRWPDSDVEAGTMSPSGVSDYCAGFIYSNGAGDFVIDVDETAIGELLAGINIGPRLSPVPSLQGGVDWYCSRGLTDTAGVKYLPATCRGT
jgi:type IV pilus assembly protein PilA